jgi:hypothetical protein
MAVLYVPLRSESPQKPQFVFTRGYKAFIELIKEAEQIFVENAIEATTEHIHILRGLFYGTTWSVDYEDRKSEKRNAAFNIYTYSTEPIDPRPLLGIALFNELRQCAEVHDTSTDRFDFGHCIIGLDSRNSFMSRNSAWPGHGGGTGFEVCTWLGDLGGGASMLAMKRAAGDPTHRAIKMFPRSGHSYGSWVNIEGDVAAYLVASAVGGAEGAKTLDLDPDKRLSTVLEEYLLNSNEKNFKEERAKQMLLALGCEFDENGIITNEKDVRLIVASKIFEFADLYMVQWFYGENKLDIDRALNASKHFLPAAVEVTTIFFQMLKTCMQTPRLPLTPVGIDPDPKPPSKPLLEYVAMKKAEGKLKDYIDELKDRIDQLWR